MTEDRRAYDPFAPAPSAMATEDAESSGSEPEPGEQEPFSDDEHESSGGDVESDGLDDMRRTDLLDLAEEEGVGAYGTKADLIARIRKHRQG